MVSRYQTLDERTQRHQSIRKKRLLMSIGPYCLTTCVLIIAYFTELLRLEYVLHYAYMSAAIVGCLYTCFIYNKNLLFRDPNLTEVQMLLSIAPAVYVMFYIENSQARTALIPLAIIPILFGTLSLNTKRLAIVAAINFIAYLILISMVLKFHPELVNVNAEIVQTAALFIVLIQLAWIGGYISKLRSQLNDKNVALNDALSKINKIANTDDLTGAHNRRYVLEQLQKELNRCIRGSSAFSICMIDIDYFKNINDKYGHLTGDDVLKKTVQLMSATTRNIDIIGRYGGEEFLLIMPQTPIEGAMIKSNRLRNSIEQLSFPNITDGLTITVSIGVTQFYPNDTTQELIARADKALYKAKEQGRNCVVNAELISSSSTPTCPSSFI